MLTTGHRCQQYTKSGQLCYSTSLPVVCSDLHALTPHPRLVRNLLVLSRTQVSLVDIGLRHLQARTVAVTVRSTRSPGANRHPSGCEAFRPPHLAPPV